MGIFHRDMMDMMAYNNGDSMGHMMEPSLKNKWRCLAFCKNDSQSHRPVPEPLQASPQAVQAVLEQDVLNLTLEMLHSHKDHGQILSRCLQLLWSFLREDGEVREQICTQEMLDVVLEDRVGKGCLRIFLAVFVSQKDRDYSSGIFGMLMK